MHKEAHWQRSAVMNWCSQDLVHPLINNNLQSSIHWWLIDTIVFIRRKDIPHNHRCDITYAQFWIKVVHKCFGNIFIISIYGLVYFHQNTKQFFVEFTGTKDALSLKQHQQFFFECIVLIIVDDVNIKVISITYIDFIQLCDGWFRDLLFITEFLVYVDGFK
jgi:hypothetical protein